MIHYELCCAAGHQFDGWFKDSASFEKQAQADLLECPHCGSTQVTRALMAPALSKRSRELSLPQPAPTEAPVALDETRIPAQVRAALQRLRAEVESNCDYVGPDFAEEARRIHRGDSERRGIYGETTPEQAETLAEEGIQIARIPWLPRADG